MPSILTTLFGDDEAVIGENIREINDAEAFPARKRIAGRVFLDKTCDDSIIITGGSDRDRSVLLLALARKTKGPVIIIHNGNKMFNDFEKMRDCQIDAVGWDVYSGLTRKEIISALVSDKGEEDLAFFYSFAMDVCVALGKPITLQSMYDINWAGIEWQTELLMSSDKERAADLLHRYDKEMAEKALKGTSKLEHLMRGNNDCGLMLDEGLRKKKILVKEVYGSDSAACKICLEIVNAAAERGEKFTLILDNVYRDVPIIKENYRNVRLILAVDDILQCDSELRITRRNCSIVAFKHFAAESARRVSEHYFGFFTKLVTEESNGYNSEGFGHKTYSHSTEIKRIEERRLKPNMILTIPEGIAFIKTLNDIEGYIDIEEGV